MSGFVWVVRTPEDEEINVFELREDALDYAGLFAKAYACEEPLLDAEYVREVRFNLEEDR